MSLIIPANTLASGGYEVANSLRFNEGSSDELTRTFGTATSRKIFTLSFWIKRTNLSGYDSVFFGDTAGSNNADQNSFYFHENFYLQFGGWNNPFFTSTRLFRDVSAWYHIVIAVDTTQGTAGNRVKLYVNGVQETYTSGSGFPNQNDDLGITKSGNHSWFGNDAQSGRGNGYLAETVLIDGTALAPTSFGEFDEDSGIWKPIDVSGLTFGNNGFYLDFEDSSALGADVSGESNNFTVNNLTAIDQTTDTPTNNFCTLNPLVPTGGTYTEGNLQYQTATTDGAFCWSSITPSSGGNWYCEAKMISSTSGTYILGITTKPITTSTGRLIYVSNGAVYQGGSQVATYATFTTNDIIGMAYNSSTKSLTFYKNGTSQGSVTADQTDEYFFGSHGQSGGATHTIAFNFGNPPFAISSGNTDGDGYGNFEYAVPSGYYALNTKNLAEYG